MKKFLLLTTAIFMLVGCNQANDTISVDEPAADGTTLNTYNNEEFNISFNYPLNWTIDEQDRFEHAVGFSTNDGYIFFDYQVDREEYENMFKDTDRVSIQEITLGDYPVKEYRMEGAVKYLVEIDNKSVLFDSEFDFTQDQKEGMKKILNSFSS